MSILLNKRLALVLLAAALAAGIASYRFSTPAFAQVKPDISFPIAELGGCADRHSCEVYCDDPAHADSCIAFAKAHGLKTESDGAEEKVAAVLQDGGPGGCAKDAENPGASCKAYCDTTAHMETCISYARDHGLLKGEELAQAERVATALQSGAVLPAACHDNPRSCKEVCENPDSIETARACFEFGKAAGLLPPGADIGKAEKAFEAIASGKTPFSSLAELKQCDDPPSDDVLQKCVAFGEAAGFISPEEAAMIRKTGGRGPGGCRGKDACEAFCNDPANRQTCFSFAKENGLLKPEDDQKMRDNAAKMREMLGKAPKEVVSCIRQAVPNLDAVLSGDDIMPPGKEDSFRACFDSYFEQGGGAPQGQEGHGMDFPPEVRQCIHDALGVAPEDLGKSKEIDQSRIDPVIRRCVQAHDAETGRNEDGQDSDHSGERAGPGPNPPQIPEGARGCIEEKTGQSIDALMRAGPSTPEVERVIGACMSGAMGGKGAPFGPEGARDDFPPPPGDERAVPPAPANDGTLPPPPPSPEGAAPPPPEESASTSSFTKPQGFVAAVVQALASLLGGR